MKKLILLVLLLSVGFSSSLFVVCGRFTKHLIFTYNFTSTITISGVNEDLNYKIMEHLKKELKTKNIEIYSISKIKEI